MVIRYQTKAIRIFSNSARRKTPRQNGSFKKFKSRRVATG